MRINISTFCCNLVPIVLLLLLPVHNLIAQSYYFNHYQVEDGLSNNAVICSIQDKNGFLWFGTKDGLNRFEGYSFKVFRNNGDDSLTIGSNFIYSLHEDSEGNLWVGCDRGLYLYNPIMESFSAVDVAPTSEVRDIQEYAGDLWFVCKGQLYQYNKTTGVCRVFRRTGAGGATSVCLSGGTLWVATSSGTLEKYDPSKRSFTAYEVFGKLNRSASKWIETIYDTGKGSLLVGTSKHGAKLFDTHTGAVRDILIYNADKTEIFVRDFIHHSGDEYWIASESGIYVYNMKTREYTSLKKNYNDPYSISDNAVYTFCKDREGGIWAGTYFGGLNYFPRQYAHFKKFFPQYDMNSISGNAVREICKDEQGNMWIGTEDAGLNKLNPETGKFTHFSPGKSRGSIAHTNIHGLLLQGNELWIGTFHHGLDVMNIQTGKVIRHYSMTTHSLASDFIYCLYATRSGKILVGTDHGLYYYDRQKDDFTLIEKIPPAFYTIIYEDHEGMIWAGTYSEGLYYFHPQTGQRGHLKYEPGSASSLSGNRVNWIMEDAHKTLWIATEGGLCEMNRETKTFRQFTTRNGFPSNMIFAVLEDKQKNFWISSSKGLVHFSPATNYIHVYTKADGLLSDQFNYNSAFKDADGRMYFGSVKGLISFHPDGFLKSDFQPPVYITGFQVYDKELPINKEGSPLKRSISFTKSITLRHDESSFSIDFAALSYTAPETTEYAYRMDGLNENWTYLKVNRKAYFTQLAPGNYTFYVKASRNSNNWNGHPAVLEIKILPPWWASPYAYVLYAVILLTVVYVVVRGYLKRSEAKNRRKLELLEHEKEKELYHAKIEFFTHIAHEIRTPLTLIKGPMEKVMKQARDQAGIRNNLVIMENNTNRLLDLTSQLLDFRKTEINGFDLNFVKTNVSELLNNQYQQFKTAAEQKQLHFIIDVPEKLCAYVDMEALNKIISNLIDNAVKYARQKVYIGMLPFREGDDNFTIVIKNDGYLIPYEMREKIFETFFRIRETNKESGTGIGLALARSLVDLHKGILVLTHPEEGMNVFHLTLPVHQEIEFNLGA